MHLFFGNKLVALGEDALRGENKGEEPKDSKATNDGFVMYSNNEPLKSRTIVCFRLSPPEAITSGGSQQYVWMVGLAEESDAVVRINGAINKRAGSKIKGVI